MKIACVVLAAGAGTRMGGVAKALLLRDEQTFLQRIVATAQADEVVVVVGPPFGEVVAAHARELGARVVVNAEPSRGMSSSINLGFTRLDADAAWLWPVDHPDVQARTLRTLIAQLDGREIARPVCDGRGGHPPLVRRAVFERLAHCQNARDVINAADVIDVEVDDRGTIEDVDR